MTELKQIQQRMAAAIFAPLTRDDRMKSRNASGRSMHAESVEFIKPNDRLSSFERLEIYNRQYWFRVLDALAADFPGVRALLGERGFERLSKAYLAECPSRSYTLRNLGSRLPAWLKAHPECLGRSRDSQVALAADMARLEWAHVEAFDRAAEPALGPEDLLEVTADLRLDLQPYLRLLQLSYPVDDLLFSIRQKPSGETNVASDGAANNAVASNAGSTQRKRLPAVLPAEQLQAQPVYLVLHRKEYIVCSRRLEREAFRLLRALERHIPLGIAIEQVGRTSRLGAEELAARLQAWFADWSRMGWFTKPASRETMPQR